MPEPQKPHKIAWIDALDLFMTKEGEPDTHNYR